MIDAVTSAVCDPARLAALHRTNLLDSLPEEAFDRLTRLAHRVLKAPVSLVSLVDTHRQFFKSAVGLPEPLASRRETPLTYSFCKHAVAARQPLVVEDARCDPRVQDNPAVPELGVVAYAGIPIITSDGQALGSFCVVDVEPRAWTPDELSILQDLTASVVTEIELRHDIAERQRAEAALRESEQRFRLVIDESSEGIFLFNPGDKRLLDANPAFLQMLGYTADTLRQRTLYDLVAHDAATVDRHVQQIVAQKRHMVGDRCYRRSDGSELDVEVNANCLMLGGAQVICVVVRDVTERKRYEQQLAAYQAQLERANAELEALAVLDGLTGVKNRRAFGAQLDAEVTRATRYTLPLSLVMLDVDHFKSYNDTFGHPAGDEVLRIVGRVLQETVRTTDFVARYGGEEFVALLPNAAEGAAVRLAERCREALERAPWPERRVTASFGVATLAPGIAGGGALVAEADRALYYAKEHGRNRVAHAAQLPV